MASQRIQLAKLGDKKRYRFIGAFVRSGFKSTFHGDGISHRDCYAPTILLKNVLLLKNNKMVTHHLWLNYTKGFRRLKQLNPDDKIIFNARVNTYFKGYGSSISKTLDYGLSFPTKIQRDHAVKREPVPIENKNALIGYIMEKNRDFYIKNNRPYDPWYIKQFNQWNE